MPLTIAATSRTLIISPNKLSVVRRFSAQISVVSQSWGSNFGRTRPLLLSPQNSVLEINLRHVQQKIRIRPAITIASIAEIKLAIDFPVLIAPTASLSLNGKPLRRQRIARGDSCFIEFLILGKRIGGMQIRFVLFTLKGEVLLAKEIRKGIFFAERPSLNSDQVIGSIAIMSGETIFPNQPRECELSYTFSMFTGDLSQKYTLESGYLNFY